jgi:SSS family solute:Na+ symporter
LLYVATYAWSLGWVLVFIAGTVFFLTREISNGDWSAYDSLWLGFWHTKLWLELGISAVVIVWFTIGGVRDIKALLRGLDQRSAAEQDDGIVS